MANDVFLSYARVDIARARQIKNLLEDLGLSVFFDAEGLDSGDIFPDVLDREVKTAGAVVGVWSTHALTRPWVKIECTIGNTRGVLVPLQIEPIADLDRPATFWNIQFADLSDFDGNTGHAGWLRFVRSLAHTLERPELLERENARQATMPEPEAGDVRAELVALRSEMAAMRKRETQASNPLAKQASPRRSKTPLIAGGLIAALASAAGWAFFTAGTVPDQPWDQISDKDWSTTDDKPLLNQALMHTSLPDLREAANADNPNAATLAGIVFEYGETGLSQDYAAAIINYRTGCSGGNLRGCINLGYMYFDGQGVTQDYNEARRLYTKACKGENMFGCNSLGYMYQHARGMTQNDAEARRFYTQACNGENMHGCNNLAYMYKNAKGVSQNYGEAKRLYTKACEGGFQTACDNLQTIPN